MFLFFSFLSFPFLSFPFLEPTRSGAARAARRFARPRLLRKMSWREHARIIRLSEMFGVCDISSLDECTYFGAAQSSGNEQFSGDDIGRMCASIGLWRVFQVSHFPFLTDICFYLAWEAARNPGDCPWRERAKSGFCLLFS